MSPNNIKTDVYHLGLIDYIQIYKFLHMYMTHTHTWHVSKRKLSLGTKGSNGREGYWSVGGGICWVYNMICKKISLCNTVTYIYTTNIYNKNYYKILLKYLHNREKSVWLFRFLTEYKGRIFFLIMENRFFVQYILIIVFPSQLLSIPPKSTTFLCLS